MKVEVSQQRRWPAWQMQAAHEHTAAVFLLSTKTVRGCHPAYPAALRMTSMRNDLQI